MVNHLLSSMGLEIRMMRLNGARLLSLPAIQETDHPAATCRPRARRRHRVAALSAVALALSGEAARAASGFFPVEAFFQSHPLATATLGIAALAMAIILAIATLLYRQTRRHLTALQQSNERLTGYVEATSDWVWQTDTEHRFIFVSSQLTRQTGITVEDALGRTAFELWLRNVPDLVPIHRATIAARRPFRNVVYPMVVASGQQCWFSANGIPRFDAQGRFTGYLGTTRDVTEEVSSKRQLDDNEAVTSYLVDAVPDAIIFCQPDRRIVRVNPKFCALFGYSFEEAFGRTTEFLYATRAGYEASGQRIFDSHAERRLDPHVWPMRRKSGEVFMVEVVGCSVRNDAGEEIGSVGVLRDITEREEAHAALRRAKEAAEFANRSKSQFLAHMSHELRTPLNAILGFSEILKLEMHGKLGDARYAEYVDDIHGSGALLLSMINDILDLSRIEAGKLDLIDREIDPDALIEDSLRFLRDRAARRGISIQIGESVEGMTLFADERLVKQMLLNLLSNAVKFTPPEGIIRVFVTLDDTGDLRIAVADTGIGIAPDDVERVRRPFAQAHRVWHKSGEGTGIGLYLVDSLIKAHGGSMHIASELGNGTIVTLRFPAARVHLHADGGGVEAVG
jgi:PAS domain S-box-containing protein